MPANVRRLLVVVAGGAVLVGGGLVVAERGCSSCGGDVAPVTGEGQPAPSASPGASSRGPSAPAGRAAAAPVAGADPAGAVGAAASNGVGAGDHGAAPGTERALIEAVARALGDRDLASLQELAAPEYAADLRRLHDEDGARFWRRGAKLVDDVKSGFEITHREDDTSDSWRVLVKFGTGREERMTFTRVEGELRVVDL